MAIITLCSASGSPGVSTTALAFALNWPRPNLLIEADPAGTCSLGVGYFKGAVRSQTILELAGSYARGTLYDDLRTLVTPIEGSKTQVLFGTKHHAQANALKPVWEPLSHTFASLERNGQDIIIDAGRLGLQHSPKPLIERADVCLLLLRSSAPAAVGAVPWAQSLRESYVARGMERSVQALVMGEKRPYPSAVIQEALGIPVLGALDWDPVNAAVFSDGEKPSSKFGQSALARGYQATSQAIVDHIDRVRRELGITREEQS